MAAQAAKGPGKNQTSGEKRVIRKGRHFGCSFPELEY
jgi:hypothetical protein